MADTESTYTAKLQQAITAADSTLCVGLDPNPDRLPPHLIEQSDSMASAFRRFCLGIIEATSDYCAAYKPNIAFFEAIGPDGIDVFADVVAAIPDEKICIADAKRGDIGTTAQQYDTAFFEHYGVDALTVNPLMGMDTLSVYADHPSKSLYVLTLTSNPGAADFLLQTDTDDQLLATRIATRLRDAQSNSQTHLGMVVGATNADHATAVLQAHPQAALLVPGIGAQGGSVDLLARQLRSHAGLPLISSSRSIIYADTSANGWKQGAARAAQQTKAKLDPITNRYV
ncbi:MAG: orotidine-5'-phosphate decarboxylase [Bacteroidota bacterium]